MRKTEQVYWRESRKELGDAQSYIRKTEHSERRGQGGKGPANPIFSEQKKSIQRYKSGVQKETSQLKPQERKSLADCNYENIKADLKDLEKEVRLS